MQVRAIHRFQSSLCIGLIVELNVSVSLARSISVGLELARVDVTESLEGAEQLLLSHFLVKVLHDQVGLGVIVHLSHGGNSQSLTIENMVVHFCEASLSFIFGVELEVSITKRLAGFLVKGNLGALEFVTMAGEQLVEVEIEEALSGKVANIETRELVLLFSGEWGGSGLAEHHALHLLIKRVAGEEDSGDGSLLVHHHHHLLLLRGEHLALHHLLGRDLSLLLRNHCGLLGSCGLEGWLQWGFFIKDLEY
jgi:hypothetical protein